MTYSLTVYTKDNCVQCTAVKRSLTSKGVRFREEDAIANADELKRLGYMQAPVTFFEGYGQKFTFGGFDAFKIDEISALISEDAA